QPVGQQVRADARKVLADLAEPGRADQQLPDDQQRPALADDVQRDGQPAELAVVTPVSHGISSTTGLAVVTARHSSHTTSLGEAQSCPLRPSSPSQRLMLNGLSACRTKLSSNERLMADQSVVTARAGLAPNSPRPAGYDLAAGHDRPGVPTCRRNLAQIS